MFSDFIHCLKRHQGTLGYLAFCSTLSLWECSKVDCCGKGRWVWSTFKFTLSLTVLVWARKYNKVQGHTKFSLVDHMIHRFFFLVQNGNWFPQCRYLKSSLGKCGPQLSPTVNPPNQCLGFWVFTFYVVCHESSPGNLSEIVSCTEMNM